MIDSLKYDAVDGIKIGAYSGGISAGEFVAREQFQSRH